METKDHSKNGASLDSQISRIKLNGKYGFIDKSGKIVIPIKYDFASNYFDEDGFAEVRLGEKILQIDRKGNETFIRTGDENDGFWGLFGR